MTFDRTPSGADVRLDAGAGQAGQIEVPWVLRFIGMSGMDVGRDAGSPISDAYEPPFAFDGGFTNLEFEVTEELPPQEVLRLDRERVRREFTRQ